MSTTAIDYRPRKSGSGLTRRSVAGGLHKWRHAISLINLPANRTIITQLASLGIAVGDSRRIIPMVLWSKLEIVAGVCGGEGRAERECSRQRNDDRGALPLRANLVEGQSK